MVSPPPRSRPPLPSPLPATNCDDNTTCRPALPLVTLALLVLASPRPGRDDDDYMTVAIAAIVMLSSSSLIAHCRARPRAPYVSPSPRYCPHPHLASLPHPPSSHLALDVTMTIMRVPLVLTLISLPLAPPRSRPHLYLPSPSFCVALPCPHLALASHTTTTRCWQSR